MESMDELNEVVIDTEAIPEHSRRNIADSLSSIYKFFADPANETAFREWKAERKTKGE